MGSNKLSGRQSPAHFFHNRGTPQAKSGLVVGPPSVGGGPPRPLRAAEFLKQRVVLFFTVEGTPVPQPRFNPRGFMPKTAHPWKHQVRAAAKLELLCDPALTGAVPRAEVPFGVHVIFYFDRPKKHFRTGKFSGMLKPNAPTRHFHKPDEDNLRKAVLDALGTFDGLPPLVWADDGQVCGGGQSKFWADPPQKARAEVLIVELNP